MSCGRSVSACGWRMADGGWRMANCELRMTDDGFPGRRLRPPSPFPAAAPCSFHIAAQFITVFRIHGAPDARRQYCDSARAPACARKSAVFTDSIRSRGDPRAAENAR
ncbi:hypothetical protein EMIT0158MI4_130033 [Burkholderia ambifaria]